MFYFFLFFLINMLAFGMGWEGSFQTPSWRMQRNSLTELRVNTRDVKVTSLWWCSSYSRGSLLLSICTMGWKWDRQDNDIYLVVLLFFFKTMPINAYIWCGGANTFPVRKYNSRTFHLKVRRSRLFRFFRRFPQINVGGDSARIPLMEQASRESRVALPPKGRLWQ